MAGQLTVDAIKTLTTDVGPVAARALADWMEEVDALVGPVVPTIVTTGADEPPPEEN